MKNLLLISILLLFAFGCAKQEELTETKIKLDQFAVSSDFPGGIFILAHNIDTGLAMQKRIQGNELLLELPNGRWEFGAIGWDSASPYTGEPFCDFTPPISLEGGDINISLNNSKTNCSKGPFYRNNFNLGNNAPKELKIISCAGAYQRTNGGKELPSDKECQDFKGAFKSFKVVMYDIALSPPQERSNVLSNPFESNCISGGGNNYTTSSGIHIPAYQGIPQYIIAYSDTSCSGSSYQYSFKSGFYSTESKEEGFTQPETNSISVYLDNNICYGSNPDATTEIGSGTEANPFVICHPSELNAMAINGFDKTYLLGNNIDGSSVTTQTGTNFTGRIIGNNKSISGLTNPLFDIFQGDIEDITFNDFNITTSEVNFGILAKKLESSSSHEISNITIKDFSITSTYSTSTICQIGALFGHINLVSNSHSIELEDINITTTQSSTPYYNNLSHTDSGFDSCRLGSVAGEISAPAVAPPINYNDLKVKIENINIENTKLSSTDKYLGGIFGKIQRANILFANVSNTHLTGRTTVGGITGEAKGSRIIYSAFASDTQNGKINKISCIHNDGLSGSICENIGGVVGEQRDATLISNIFSSFTIEDLPGEEDDYQKLGGISGYIGNSIAQPNLIEHIASYQEWDVDGRYIGGIAGQLQDNQPPYPNKGHIYSSQFMGHIKFINVQDNNFDRAGIVGKILDPNSETRMTLSIGEIQGSNSIGLIAGTSVGTITEAYAKGKVYAHTNGQLNYSIGGLIGVINNGRLSNSHADDLTIEVTGDASTCNTTTRKCGLIGEKISSYTITYIQESNFVENYLTGSCNPTYSVCTATTDMVTAHPTQPWTASNSRLLFETKWKQLGTKSTPDGDIRYAQGNVFEPLKVSNVSQWNTISDDAFLLNKAIVLGNDIDFSGAEFIPIGYKKNAHNDYECSGKFTGTLLSGTFGSTSSYALKNISFDTSSITNCPNAQGLGVVAYTESSSYAPVIIGYPKKPFRVENFQIERNSTIADLPIGSIVGKSTASVISAHVQGYRVFGNYTESTAGHAAVGGIVGHSAGYTSIENSEVTLDIDQSNVNYIGGIIGHISAGTTEIEKTKSKIYRLKSLSSQAGIVGNTTVQPLKIKNTIANLENALEISSAKTCGFICNLSDGNDIKENLVIYNKSAATDTSTTSFSFMDVTPSPSVEDSYVIGVSDSSHATGYYDNINDFILAKGFGIFSDISYDASNNEYELEL